MKHYTKAEISKASRPEADFVAVASTAVEDRHGEIVSVEGWDTKAFQKNPVLLWAHDHYEMAVGKATKIWVEGTGKRAKLMIEGTIHEYTDRARALKQLVKDGVINTMSVGFRAIEMEGDTYTSQELLEVSFVNVPANPQAVISAVKSLEGAGFQKDAIADLGLPVYFLDDINQLKAEVKELKESVVKAPIPSAAAPQGRYSRVIRERQAMAKIIVRASDKLLEANKSGLPAEQRVRLTKAIKRAGEHLIVSHKEQIKNGKN